MLPALTIGVVFTETPIYYRYTSQKPCTFLLFIDPPTAGKLFPDFGRKTPVFPWLENVFKIFPDRWETWILLNQNFLKKGRIIPTLKVTIIMLKFCLKLIYLFRTKWPNIRLLILFDWLSHRPLNYCVYVPSRSTLPLQTTRCLGEDFYDLQTKFGAR